MNNYCFHFLFTIIMILSFTQCKSQEIISKDLTEKKLLTAAKEIMTNAGNCALITQDLEGRAKVRTMDPFLPEEDFTIWFGTNPRSRKVKEIKNDPRVTLYYFDKKIQGYVTILGEAELVNDLKIKQKKWKDAWADFYPDREKDYMLIKVTPQVLEVLSPHHHIYNEPSTWLPPAVIFNEP